MSMLKSLHVETWMLLTYGTIKMFVKIQMAVSNPSKSARFHRLCVDYGCNIFQIFF